MSSEAAFGSIALPVAPEPPDLNSERSRARRNLVIATSNGCWSSSPMSSPSADRRAGP